MGIVLPQVVTSDRASGAQVIDGSLNIESSKSQFLSRLPASSGNRKTWTWSCWVKKPQDEGFSDSGVLFEARLDSPGSTDANIFGIRWLTDGTIGVYDTGTFYIQGTREFRDTSAWYHLVLSVDTTQASNNLSLYVNGDLYLQGSYAQNTDTRVNDTCTHRIGARTTLGGQDAHFLSSQLAQTYFIDGQALGPENFGYTDPLTNTWRPKKYEGTFGTNGVYLPMDGNSPIGEDKSGKGNNWTPVNFGGSVALPKATGARPILNTDGGGNVARPGVFGSEVGAYYAVTVSNPGSGNKYYLDGVLSANPTLTRGATYTFDQSDSSNSGHPLVFGTTADGNNYSDGVTTNGTPGSAGAYTKITVPHNAPDTLYYHCSVHSGMGSSTSQITDETKADPYAWKNFLALPLVGSDDDVSNSVNSGSTAKVATNSSVDASSVQSNFYSGSHHWSANSDTLQYAEQGNELVFGSGDYTIECWLYDDSGHNGTGNRCYIFDNRIGGSVVGDPPTMTGFIDSHNEFNFYDGTNTITYTVSSTVGKWSHYAVTREGTTTRMFIDGVLRGSNTSSTNFTNNGIGVGRATDAGYGFAGYIQDFRVYNGVAKYTSDFVVPATSPDILPDTPSGVSGGSKLAKSTDGAVSFDGSGDYLSLTSSSDLEMGTGDFTIEMYVYSTDSSTDTQDRRFFATEANATSSIQVGHINTTAGIVEYADQGNANIRVTGTTSILNKWAHVAVVRNSGTVSLYIDGKSEGTPATDSNSKTASTPTIGKYPGASGHFKGFLSNIRVLKGTALYTSNFTPPTRTLTNVTNTKLLCCQSTASATAAAVGESTISRLPSGFSYWSDGYTAGWSAAGSKTSGASTSDYVSSALPTSGKYYWETTINNPATYRVIGVTDDGGNAVGNDGYQDNMSGFYFNGNPPLFLAKKSGGTTTASNVSHGTNVGGTNWADGDIIQWAFDAGNSKMWVGRNGTWYSGDPGAGTGEAFSSMPASPYFKLAYAATGGNSMTFEIMSAAGSDTFPSANGNAAATTFNPFTTDINAVRGQESGYATLNPLATQKSGSITLSDGNLKATVGSTRTSAYASLPFVKKMYYELTFTNTAYVYGMAISADFNSTANTSPQRFIGESSGSYGVGNDGTVYNNGASIGTVSAFTVGDCMGWAYDSDSGEFTIFKNGVNLGSFTASTSRTYYPAVTLTTSGAIAELNFGQNPFKFPPPDGFQPLNAANVRPETVIVRPDQYVGVTTYNGTGNPVIVSGLNMKPDFIWIKNRGASQKHTLVDSVRTTATGEYLASDSTQAEGTGVHISGVENGISIADPNSSTIWYNDSSYSYVAWCWKAGGNKNTFNVDDVGYASAADVNMSVGGLNSSTYNTSAIWSGMMSGPSNSGVYTSLFDGTDGDAGGYEQATDGNTLTFTPTGGITATSSIEIYAYQSSGTYAGSADITVNGSSIKTGAVQSALGTGTAGGYVNIGTTSLTTLTWSNPSGSNNDYRLMAIKVDGKILVDSNQTPPNVPSIAATGASVGTKQGFSIIKYDGTGTSTSNTSTISHGLSQAPTFLIVKGISGTNAADDWFVYHKDVGITKRIRLNLTNAADTQPWLGNPGTLPTSSLVTITQGWYSVNYSGHTHIMYAWHDVPGLQKFGSYTGNGTADNGPFVELGFRPAIILIKRTTTGTGGFNWTINDSERNKYNPSGTTVFPNLSNQESTNDEYEIDFLSNGFKPRCTTPDSINVSGQTYIYAAWAEAPSFNLYGAQSNAR